MNVTLFRNGICSDAIKLRFGHSEAGWALIQYDWCPYERRASDTQGEDSYVTTKAEIGQETPKIASRQPEARKKQGSIPLMSSSLFQNIQMPMYLKICSLNLDSYGPT